MDIIAHRGFADDFPENTLEAFSAAQADSDLIELDVRFSADGVPVVIHDSTLDRTCGVSKRVSDCTAEELESIPVTGANHGVPRLATVLETIDDTTLFVELKESTDVDRIVELCESASADVIYHSFNPDALAALPYEVPKVIICTPERLVSHSGVATNAYTSLEDAVAFADHIGAVGVSVHHEFVDEGVVSNVDTGDLCVFAWTVRSREVGERLAAAEVDGVITDSLRYLP